MTNTTAQYDSYDVTSMFAPGDRVKVADVIVGTGNFAHYLAFHGQEVTVVNYWRNGYYIVREDRFGTTVAELAE